MQLGKIILTCLIALLFAVTAAAGGAAESVEPGPVPVGVPQDAAGSGHRVRSGADLTVSSIFAADCLAANMLGRIHPGYAIVASSFVDLDDLNRSSKLGRLVAHQIGSRLAEHGYRVLEPRLRSDLSVREGQGEFLLSRRSSRLAAPEVEARAALTGTYSATSAEVYVSARVNRLEDGAVIAAYEYTLPNSGAVRRLVAPVEGSSAWQSYVDARFGRHPRPDGRGHPAMMSEPGLPRGGPEEKKNPEASGAKALDEVNIPADFPQLQPPSALQ